MKPKHWINLIGIALAAGFLTFLAFHWAITSYAEPTCRRLAESQGATYIGFIPPDPTYRSSHVIRDGDCQLRASNGKMQTISLLKASGTSYGAPLLVSLALMWNLVFPASFVGVAFILAMVMRAFSPKRAAQ